MTERRADEATRDVDDWLKCYYMQDRIGETFTGSVSGVTAFGAFVALDELYVEGLVHISELGKDYFHFDAAKHQLMGERTHQRYRLGDRVRVKLVRVDLDTSQDRLSCCLAVAMRRQSSACEARFIYGFHAVTSRLRQSAGEREGDLSSTHARDDARARELRETRARAAACA